MRFTRLFFASAASLALLSHALGAEVRPEFVSPFCTLSLDAASPRFTRFAIDGLGKAKVRENFVLPATPGPGLFQLERLKPEVFVYRATGASPKAPELWRLTCKERELILRSEYAEGAPAVPFSLTLDQKANHATLLGIMQPGRREMPLPALLHLPDYGSVRITSSHGKAALTYDARRRNVPHPFVQVAFPPATRDRRAVEYRLEIDAIYPDLKGIRKDPAFDGFRRGFLNMFQVNPRLQMLANNASSDPCAFTLFKYARVARQAPKLVGNVTALDLVRVTLDQYLSGMRGYGQAGYGTNDLDADLIPWKTPYTSLDSMPSLVLAACDYIEGAGDHDWAWANYAKIHAWAREMISSDKNGNGLMEYPRTGNYGDRPGRDNRPANWWDTINFGHEDAYSNALIYNACHRFAALARRMGQEKDARVFSSVAARIAVAYVPAFLNPQTGILAGWRSADGQLHDYWFTFVNGAAITYGLVDTPLANQIMDRLLARFNQAGYTNFSIGFPGNLVPIRKGDYVLENSPPERTGEPRREDGSDGFQFYENGGATGCFTWFTIKALYQLGRTQDARRLFLPMLAGYNSGNFQGFCPDTGRSKDWRDWQGGCHGYEGLLVDNYLSLLLVMDEVNARNGH
jgi:hypothetical protein